MKLKQNMVAAVLLAGIAANANAELIDSKTVEGDKNSTLTYELFDDRYSLTLDSTYEFNTFYTAFANSEDTNLIGASVNGFGCDKLNEYYICTFIPQGDQTLINTFSIDYTLQDGYKFEELQDSRKLTFSGDTATGVFETFKTYIPTIVEVSQEPPSNVTAPGMAVLLGSGLFGLALLRRKQQK